MKNFILTTIAAIAYIFAHAQNVGIGTANPAVTLDVLSPAGHTARFNGTNNMFLSIYESDAYRGYVGSYSGAAEDVDFGTGSGNTNGKVHLTIQAIPRMTVASNGNVGVGNTSPTRKLDVNGSLGVNGALFSNGQPGDAGQVLVSTGPSSAPEWKPTSFSSNTRFGLRLQKVGTASNTLDAAVTYYNQNTTDVNIDGSAITINKSGLYRFNGDMAGLVQGVFTELPEMTCDMNLSGGTGFQFDLMQWKHMPKRTAVNNNYYSHEAFEVEMYITAPATVSFSMSFLAESTPTYAERNLKVFCHLISE